MRKNKLGLGTLALSMVLGVGAPVFAQSSGSSTPVQADNTAKNKRDRKAGEPTADQQKENTSDRELTAKIRRAIMDDKSLSTYAHNVKIITQHGAVTLKGPVHSEEEKKSIEAKATELAGSGKVTNLLSIKGASKKAKS